MWSWLAVFVLALFARRAGAQEIDEFTPRITAELREVDPEAASLFEGANAARERDDFAEAERLYRAVLAREPRFTHAKRRLSSAVEFQGRHDEALALAREALAEDASCHNRSAVLQLLVTGGEFSPEAQRESRELAYAVQRDSAALSDELLVVCFAAVRLERLQLLRDALVRLRAEHPDDWRTEHFGVIEALGRGDLEAAQTLLASARERGLPKSDFELLSEAIDESRSPLEMLASRAAWVFGGWTAAFLALLGAGAWLSRAALRASERAPAPSSGDVVGFGRGLRRLYHVVLWLSCAFYYVSLPLVLLVVVGLGLGIVGFFLWVGRIPIQLVVIIVVVVAVTGWAMLKSLVVSRRETMPGVKLDLAREPRLRALLDDVAERIGTRAVDSVYLTPGTEVAVFERGGLRRQLRGTTERCLLLGVGVLDGFPLGALRSVLAHEYGHFQNRDTAGGTLALAVRRSLFTMTVSMLEGGAAGPFNPAWWFLVGFQRVFQRISQGASRLQEVMADRWAVYAFGGAEFERGLRHVIERAVRFELGAGHEIQAAVDRGEPLANLYEARPLPAELEAPVEASICSALEAEPSPYDSHPSPRHRFASAARLESKAALAPDSEEPAWGLFDDRAAIERRMTERVMREVGMASAPASVSAS